jgi:uncharacterized protein YndB with AHSA1/START domain
MNPNEIYNSRLINSSPEKIFSAFSEAKHLQNWWGPKGFSNTFNEFNFSKDGVWDFIMLGPDGKDYKNRSVFLEIKKPKKIVIKHITPPHFILTITLDEEDGKTRVDWSPVFETVEMRNNIAKIVKNANEENLNRLEKEITLIT